MSNSPMSKKIAIIAIVVIIVIAVWSAVKKTDKKSSADTSNVASNSVNVSAQASSTDTQGTSTASIIQTNPVVEQVSKSGNSDASLSSDSATLDEQLKELSSDVKNVGSTNTTK